MYYKRKSVLKRLNYSTSRVPYCKKIFYFLEYVDYLKPNPETKYLALRTINQQYIDNVKMTKNEPEITKKNKMRTSKMGNLRHYFTD